MLRAAWASLLWHGYWIGSSPRNRHNFNSLSRWIPRTATRQRCRQSSCEAVSQVMQTRNNSPRDRHWRVFDERLKVSSRDNVHYSIAVAPHKMRLTGDELEASTPEDGERADVLLLAWPGMEPNPWVLGFAYHTTTVVAGPASNSKTQASPESRIHWSTEVN